MKTTDAVWHKLAAVAVAATSAILLIGCVTEPKVESTKPWENHYFTVEDFKQKTSSIQLDKDESIWVLSNHTLNRLLRSAK